MGSERYVALLRGINVGGRRLLPMADLRAACGGLGWTDVSTYIQSGNVVLSAAETDATGVSIALTELIRERFELEVPVVVRTAEAFREAARVSPYADHPEIKQLHVGFLLDVPSERAIAGLDAERFAPDEFTVVGQQIYLKLPRGMGRTKITSAYLDRTLSTLTTFRNWRTVGKLIERL